MKRLVLVAFLIIASALFVEHIGTGFGAAKDAELPKYSIGDKWKLNVDYKEEIGLLGTVTYEVIGDSVEVTQFGQSYVCYELSFAGSGTVYGELFGEGVTGTWTMNGKEYWQKSDLSVVKFTATMDTTFTYAGESNTIKQVIETTYNPPLDSNKGFPLTAGKSWSAAATETTTAKNTFDGQVDEETDTITGTWSYYVLRTEVTTVVAGEFDTFVIKAIKPDGSYAESYYSSEVGMSVKQMEYDGTGKLTVTIEVVEYDYAVAKGEFPWFWFIIVVIIAVAVVASGVAYVLYKRRKPVASLAPPTSPIEQPPEPTSP